MLVSCMDFKLVLIREACIADRAYTCLPPFTSLSLRAAEAIQLAMPHYVGYIVLKNLSFEMSLLAGRMYFIKYYHEQR
ncbi:C-type lectin domain-containing protein [Candidatus Nitrososphaera gargensis Ga9.2]|uniref:C-type lectin domain-containing protein n=1 Tax=Nitrososphaera gargensis (strain Ga9.2) TaxID=1237085 RepID=K0IH26_NITGG|nr:C-type lectin domain-containing protein [Candidatus Nitrososphaera gargensis Ga9.2]